MSAMLAPRARPDRLSTARGFTLLEILVVITLLSVVMLALTSAMRTMARTEERVDQRVAEADEFRIAVSLLRSILSRVSEKKIQLAQTDQLPFLFTAGPDMIAWVGVMPARFGAGGRSFFRLAQEDTDMGKALVMRYAPWGGTEAWPDWATAESRALIPKLVAFTVQYQDSRVDPPVWMAEWTKKEYLPQQIRLSVITSTGPWPDIVVSMRALPASNAGAGGFSVGGSPL